MCKKVSASPASCRRRPSRRCPVQYEHVAPDCAGRRCRVCWPIAPHAGGCKQSALQLQGRKKFFCPVGEAGWENRSKKARPTQPHCAGRTCLNPGQVQAGACAQAVRLARQDAGRFYQRAVRPHARHPERSKLAPHFRDETRRTGRGLFVWAVGRVSGLRPVFF